MARTLQPQLRSLVPTLALLLLVLATGLDDCVQAQSATPLRIVVPDLAGMLYPMQAQHSVEFGTSRTATLVSAHAKLVPDEDAGGGASLVASCSAQFCVDLVFTSEFETDPFLLARYASALPVSCSLVTGDAQGASTAAAASAIQPVITGIDARLSSSDHVQTRWRFASNASVTTTTAGSAAAENRALAVDVLLHLKQQSQFRARNDQLLLHVVARRESVRSATTAIESFSLYGNARVTYATTRVDAQRVEITFAIARDTTQSDVVAANAYPVSIAFDLDGTSGGVHAGNWAYTTTQSECAQCARQLYGCSSDEALHSGMCDYDSTNATIVSCLRDHFHVTSAWLQSQMVQQLVGTDLPIQGMLAYCFDQLLGNDAASSNSSGGDIASVMESKEWWRATAALSCLAQRNCPIGPFNSMFTARSPAKLIALTNATDYVHALRITAPTFSGSLAIKFSVSSSASGSGGASSGGGYAAAVALSESSTEREIAAAIAAAIPIVSVAVSVLKVFDGDAWALTISLRHLLFPNLETAFELSTNGSSSVTTSDVSQTHAIETFSALRVEAFDATKLVLEATCSTCFDMLLACQQDDACRERVLPCLVARFGSLSQSQAVPVIDSGVRRIDVLASLNECALTVPAVTWSPVRKALACTAQRQCPVGADAVSGEPTVFKVANATQVFVVSPESGTSDVVALMFSCNTSLGLESHAFRASLSSLSLFVRAFVLENNGDVALSSHADPDDPSKLRVALEYSNLLGTLPTITAERGIAWIQDAPSKAYFEYVDDDGATQLSLATLLQVLQAKALRSSPIGAPSNHSWSLASECLACSAQLFECDTTRVANRTCHYATMASPFGRCLLTQLPVSAFDEMLTAANNSSSNTTGTAAMGSASAADTVVVQSDLTYCARQAVSMMPNSTGAAAATAAEAINRALSCFTASKCPFGPLDVVRDDQVVLLEASSYIHVLRIPSRTFRLTLSYRFRDSAAAVRYALIDSTMSRAAVLALVANALHASGVAPSLSTFENEVSGAEWTLEFRYANVVLPGFTVAIDANAVPAATTIQQSFLRGAPRLAVAPRNPRKLFQQAIDNSSAADSSACRRCVETEIAACQRSRFCRSTVLPCFAARLESPPLASATGASSSVSEVDVVDWLYACATPNAIATTNATVTATTAVSGMAFYNWWVPLQRFLACYARAQCRVSINLTTVSSNEAGGDEEMVVSPTVLRLQPGTETLRVPLVNASAGTFALNVAPPLAGTSFAVKQSYAFVGDGAELERLLTYMTMDAASNVSVDVGALQSDMLAPVRVSYGDDYMGLLPRLSTPSGSSDGASPPRLFFTSSDVSTAGALDWSALRDALRNASISNNNSSASSSDCVACEQQFLTECHRLEACSGQVLTCMLFAMSNLSNSSMASAGAKAGLLPLGTDRDLLAGLDCWDELPPSTWRSTQEFLSCYEQAQCAASEPTDAPSYIRLQRGRIRFSQPAPDSSQVAAFAATLANLQALFEPLTASTGATVAVQTWQSPTSSLSAGLQHVEFTFSGYYGTLPSLPLPSALSTQPRLVLYTTGGAMPSQTQLTDTLSRYILRTECASVCSDTLTACERGDSRASLVCREVVLPCFNEQLASASALSQGSTTSSSSIDLAAMLRTCTAGSVLTGAVSVADFITCYQGTRCPLSVQDVHIAPTFLQLTPGSETLQLPGVSGAVTLTIRHPSDSSQAQYTFVDEFTLSSDMRALETFLVGEVLDSSASVRVQLTVGSSSRTLAITYGDGYLSDLPVITGINVQSLARVLPQARTVSTLSTQPQRWDLFSARLASRVQNMTTKRAGCNSCATTHLTDCIECTAILQCLTQTLQLPNATDLVAISGGTGTDFSQALQSCVASYAAADWLGLGDFFTCLMEHACQVGSPTLDPRSDDATFVVTHGAYYSFDIDVEQLPLDVTLVIPSDGGSDTSTVQLDPNDGYAALLQKVKAVLALAGVESDSLVTLTETESTTSTTQTVTLTYDGYYGQLPTIEPTAGVTVTASQAAQLTFQSLEGTPNWEGIYALYSANPIGPPTPAPAPEPTPTSIPPMPVLVLASDCAQCGASLFRCSVAAINDGSCSYATPTSAFARCLVRELGASTYQSLISNSLGASVNITTTLTMCHSEIASDDELAHAASFQDDLWYAASDALTCFDIYSCPLGPLAAAVTSDFMVHLESSVVVRQFTLTGGVAFTDAVFVAKYGFRTVTSSAFAAGASSAELQALLVGILPGRAVVVAVSKVLRADSSGYDVTLVLSRLYFPGEFSIRVGTDAPVVGVVQDPWTAKIVVTNVDPTKFAPAA